MIKTLKPLAPGCDGGTAKDRGTQEKPKRKAAEQNLKSPPVSDTLAAWTHPLTVPLGSALGSSVGLDNYFQLAYSEDQPSFDTEEHGQILS